MRLFQCCLNLNHKAMSIEISGSGVIANYAKQFAATTVCNSLFDRAQGGADNLAALKARQIACGMAVPAIQSALSYVDYKSNNPGEAYPNSLHLYNAAGILGGRNLPVSFQSAPRAALSSMVGSMELIIKSYVADVSVERCPIIKSLFNGIHQPLDGIHQSIKSNVAVQSYARLASDSGAESGPKIVVTA